MSDVQRLRDLGFSLVPGSLDKQPLVQWGQWRDRVQEDEEFDFLGHGSVWGVVTGWIHGLVVLDFDGAEGVALAQRHGLTPNVITGSGGWHVWLRGDLIPYRVKTCAGVEPGLDVRGEGGLVWCAGRSRKGEYRIVTTEMGAWTDIPPHWLPERVEATASADFGTWDGEGDGTDHALAVLRTQAAKVRDAAPGTSNAALNSAAHTIGGLCASGELDPAVAVAVLLEAAEARGAGDPLRVINAGMDAGWAKPWSATPDLGDYADWLNGCDDATVPATSNETRPAVVASRLRDWEVDRLPLPLDAFPPEVRELVEIGAPITACPAEFLAAATLPALSAAVGGYVTLGLRDGWRIPPSLYLGLVGPPSASKTPALSRALAPVRDAENTGWETTDGDPANRYMVDDVTTEKLAELLNENPRGLLMVTDELKGFFGSHGQYKDGGGRDRQFYLSAWSSQPITVDRIRRGSLHVAQPTLSIVGGIQPAVFDQLTNGEPDGMMERFLLVYGDPVRDEWREDDIPGRITAAYHRLWNDMRDMGQQEIVVPLTPDARRWWKQWYDNFHNNEEPNPKLAEMWNKVRTHLARIALVLACADGGRCDASHLERAWAICQFFLSHLLHVLRVAAASSPEERRHVKERDRLGAWLRDFEADNGRKPTRREVLQLGPPGSRRAKDRDMYLDELGVAL